MVRIADWVDLAGSTIKGIDARNVRTLYEQEWPATLRTLTVEHRDAIDGRRKVPRYFHTLAALVYGLAKRLAPQRRVIFVIALLLALITAFSIVKESNSISITTVLGLLLPSFLLMSLLAMELIDKLRFRDELELARDLQKGLMPEQLPELPGFEIAAYNTVANTVGGDIYDFVPLPDGRMAVLFGDASGHGMAAGLVMAVAHAAFRTQLDIDPSPEAIVGSLNRILCRTGGNRSFFTSCYLIIEPDGRFQASLAGHPPIVQLGSQGAILRRIGEGSYPLGIRASANWSIEEGVLAPGDSIVLYSDGVVEARSAGEADYGYERAERMIALAGGLRAKMILQFLLDDWSRFTEGRAIDDDVSVAVIRRAMT